MARYLRGCVPLTYLQLDRPTPSACEELLKRSKPDGLNLFPEAGLALPIDVSYDGPFCALSARLGFAPPALQTLLPLFYSELAVELSTAHPVFEEVAAEVPLDSALQPGPGFAAVASALPCVELPPIPVGGGLPQHFQIPHPSFAVARTLLEPVALEPVAKTVASVGVPSGRRSA